MAACPAFDPTGPYVSQMVAFVDCHSLALGAAGYAALGPGTPFGMAISGLLTIYVALIGYRLLLGGQITVREGVWSALRLGFVLALATQWAAYQPLVYDVITAGPGDLAARVLAPGGLGGNTPEQLINRVQGVHAALGDLTPPPALPLTAAAPVAPVTPASPAPITTTSPLMSDEARAALVSADHMLVGTTLAGTLSVRVVTALLLALGPLFIGCMLFDATRGLFVGWVRVLAGAALAGVAAALVIALELAVIEPQVVALQGLLATGQPVGTLPQDMMATCGAFALIMLAALVALARTTGAFRLLAGAARVVEHRGPSDLAVSTSLTSARTGGAKREPDQRNRAEQIADAARASQRRDARSGAGMAAAVPALAPREPAARLQRLVVSPLPLGQSGRRTARRMSPTAGQRDKMRDDRP